MALVDEAQNLIPAEPAPSQTADSLSPPMLHLSAALKSFLGPEGSHFWRLEPTDQLRRSDRGSYALVIAVSRPSSIPVGRLGLVTFPSGAYVYCGSALGGLAARVARHRRAEKLRHWHVDHLLDLATLVEVWVARSPERLECRLASHLAALPGGELWAAGFGASDCRCPGHLTRSRPLLS
jgi:Uri superfamily endonuclease